MTKFGYQMTGVDLSANTIKQASEHAKKQNLQIRYLQGKKIIFNLREKFNLKIIILLLN